MLISLLHAQLANSLHPRRLRAQLYYPPIVHCPTAALVKQLHWFGIAPTYHSIFVRNQLTCPAVNLEDSFSMSFVVYYNVFILAPVRNPLLDTRPILNSVPKPSAVQIHYMLLP
eukprot:gb/GEZJ01005999.1/.p2 GENE.gb/GEZJ01005999.1/~~gb/GEZJ01005999.1/.p2  ORF type:complete len:114 (-),score=8.63 gb/GEZJ01005999.1/:463-804(-)